MMNSKLSGRLTLLVFATTIFVSAFLLFQVQPIMAKFILPWFGGSPSVWTTCMLVFQVLLFGGYAYAHALNRFLTLKTQIVLHCGLLLLAISTLPITPSVEWKPQGSDSPAFLIMLLLGCKVGIPYFLLSSTGPLLQSWLGQTDACQHPYRLYSLSNLGSMIALLSFPFVIEPMLSSTQQSMIWSGAFIVFAMLCGCSGLVLFRSTQNVNHGNGMSTDSQDANGVTWGQAFRWFALSMLPSVMLLATTNQICLDTGVIPFLWVIPLALYLLSFILTFESERWYRRRPTIMVAMLSFLFLYLLKLLDLKMPLLAELGLYFVGLFTTCMVCHGELVRWKPATHRLTSFYMTLSAGGACGGIFVGLIAPVLFNGYLEWQLGLLACVMVFAESYLQNNPIWNQKVPTWSKIAMAVSVPVVAGIWLAGWGTVAKNQVEAKRNFYGVMSVVDGTDHKTGAPVRHLVHGRIIHGTQLQSTGQTFEPTTYYTRTSGVGIAMTNHQGASRAMKRNIGVVGLGAGTLAAYGKKGERFRFYEINPHVVEMANDHFTFLEQTAADVEVVLGDARLTLEREPSQAFDILVLDAFSGDAIPVHLLTGEAMQIYLKHLNHDGILAIHISNLYFDLKPIVQGLASAHDLKCNLVVGDADASPGAQASLWVLLSRDERSLLATLGTEPTTELVGRPVLWTDDRSNLLEALR